MEKCPGTPMFYTTKADVPDDSTKCSYPKVKQRDQSRCVEIVCIIFTELN